MANTYFNPYLVNPYFVPQAPTFQPNYYQPLVPVQQNQPKQEPQGQFSSLWFNGGENEAKAYPVGPNNAVALWSESEPVIFLKSADATGKPSLKIYDLTERNTTLIEEKTGEYITKEDFNSLGNIVSGFADIVSSLKNDIETIKSDMYGIAGKKKTVTRKSEVEEDA